MSDKPSAPDELEGTEQPFVTHLVELRDRLIRAAIAVGIAFGVLAFYPGPSGLYDLLAAPLVAQLPAGATLIATNVISPFLVPLKITLLAAFLLALPVVLYQVWAFVAPGLYSHEKRLVMPLVVSSTVLFFAGVAFSYFFVFGQVFKFIQSRPASSTGRRPQKRPPTRASRSCPASAASSAGSIRHEAAPRTGRLRGNGGTRKNGAAVIGPKGV